MQLERIIDQVRHRSGLGRAAAMRACHAVVETLGACLADSLRLAQWFPPPLRESLVRARNTGDPGLDGFYDRVAQQLEISPARARERSLAVCAALAECLPDMPVFTSWLPPLIEAELFSSSLPDVPLDAFELTGSQRPCAG